MNVGKGGKKPLSPFQGAGITSNVFQLIWWLIAQLSLLRLGQEWTLEVGHSISWRRKGSVPQLIP